MNRCHFLFFIIILHFKLTAQELEVLDRVTLRPVPFATVVNLHSNERAVTDERGKARMKDTRPDDSIRIQHLGYHAQTLRFADIQKAGLRVFLIERLLDVEEVVVSASKWEESRREIPNRIVALPAREIAFQNPQTMADALERMGEVFVQRSQMGGGSPVLRGFEANRVLLVVDGVRLNNAIYRSGHLQNVISQDGASVENAEVIFGPGSVIYGSDALGGVIDLHTISPRLSVDGSTRIHANAFGRYASANDEKTMHGSLVIGFERLGLVSSVTFSDFGDLRTGGSRSDTYPAFGERPWYVRRIDGKDSVLQNDDVNVQRPTAYSQFNALQKIRYRFSPEYDLQYSFSYATSSDVPRYDRLTESQNGVPRFADWRYGPQRWMMNTLRFSSTEQNAFFDHARFIAAHQGIDETRITRRFREMSEHHQEERVNVTSLSLDMYKEVGNVRMFYGVEAALNDVASVAFSWNIENGVREKYATRYPDGGSTMHVFAGYFSTKWSLHPQWNIAGGLRYSFIRLRSEFRDKTFYSFPVDVVEQQNGALNGSLGFVYLPTEATQINVNLSSGFRAPNVDDMGKVFDSSPGNIIVPNSGLRPETAYNSELGLTHTFASMLTVSATAFTTQLVDAIVTRDFVFDGKDSLFYDGVMSRVRANVNAGKASINGFSCSLLAELTEHLSIKASLTWTRGRDRSMNVPLDHIPPLYGMITASFRTERMKLEAAAQFNGDKKLEDYSPSGEDNLQYATHDGMPGWMVLHLRTSYQLHATVQWNAGIENILDTHYRPFASGVSGPGRNLFTALRFSL